MAKDKKKKVGFVGKVFAEMSTDEFVLRCRARELIETALTNNGVMTFSELQDAVLSKGMSNRVFSFALNEMLKREVIETSSGNYSLIWQKR